jgi:hypothetical protein
MKGSERKKKKKKIRKEKIALAETLESNRYEMLGKLSRKRVKRVFTPKIYVMHRKRRKSTQYDYRVQNPLLPIFLFIPPYPSPVTT